MWIKNEYGHLLNLTHAQILRVVTSHGDHYVQARFGSNECDYADLTRPQTESVANGTLAAIQEAIIRGDHFLDMTPLNQ